MNQMSPNMHEDDQEKPLDPAAERLRRKMVRLLAVSVGVMFIGVFSVLGAIIYKLNRAGTTGAEYQMALPQGFTVNQISASDGAIVVIGESKDGAPSVLRFNGESGALLSTGTFIEGGVPQE